MNNQSHSQAQFKDFFKLALVYSASHFWLLLNRGLFWDDWVWADNYTELIKSSRETGLGPITAILGILIYDPAINIIFSKLIIFLLYLGTGLVFRKILDYFDNFEYQEKFYLASFFLIAPLNMTKSTLCTANNALNVFLFFLGGLLVLENKTHKYNLKTLCACICFFISYFTNSLVPFMSVLYLGLLILFLKKYSLKQAITQFLKNNLIYIFLPLIFWIVKFFYFRPSGIYSQYNSINIFPIIYLIKDLCIVFTTSFIEPLFYSLLPAIKIPITFLAIIFALFISALGVKFYFLRKNFPKNGRILKILFFGFVSFIIAVFPYLAVGKTPLFNATESRHQLLLPLGFSLIFLYSFLFFLRKSTPKTLHVFGSFFILLFTFANFRIYMEFQKMHYKQQALMREFERNPVFVQNTIFLVDDQARDLSAIGYEHRYSDFSGMFFEIFKEQTRAAAISLDELSEIQKMSSQIKSRYKMKDVKAHNPEIKITMKTKAAASSYSTLKILLNSYYSQESYLKKLDHLMTYQYTKI